MPDLSGEERVRRQQAVDFARGSVQLSGGALTAESEALARRYVEGELSLQEYVDATIAHARTLPKGEPVQDYFASFEDAMRSVPAAAGADRREAARTTGRTWQLTMFGHGLEHVTAQAQVDMAQLLDLMPSITHLMIELGDDRIHVARDWPSDRMDQADDLLRRIAGSGGITAVVVPGVGDEPERRIEAHG